MDEHKPSATESDSAKEKALVGYQMAISLWIHQAEQGLARLNTMLVLNSIIIAVAGLAMTSQRQLGVLALALPLLGMLLCSIWLVLVQREGKYSDYYIRSARELEEKYLSDTVTTVSRGGLFAEDQTITIEINGKCQELRMGRLASRLRAKAAGRWLIVIVILLHLAMILQDLL